MAEYGLAKKAQRTGRGLLRSRAASFLCAWACLMGVGVWGATFTATLDRSTITLGESATLSLAFGGGQPGEPPVIPEIPNLQITYVGPSSQFSYIQGQVTSSVTYNFRVVPRQVGDYVIPGFAADVGGEKLASQPLVFKVLKPMAAAPQAIATGAQLAFLRLQIPKKEIYLGETVVGQLQIFLHPRVQNISRFQLTGFPSEGFNVGKMVESQRRQMQVSNFIYTVIPVQVPLTAVKAGNYALGPVTASVVVDVRSQNRPRDLFSEFFGGGGEQQQVTLATELEQVQLLALPRDKVPPTFNGAVGAYTMNVSAGPTNVTAGDPITVKIQITGRGLIEGLTLPEQPGWDAFKRFPATSKVETSDGFGLQGSKMFEQIVSPENSDIKALPPVSFSFFDPDSRQYRTLTQPEMPLVVRAGGMPAAPTVSAASRTAEDVPATPDIVPNKQRLGELAQISAPLARQTWFIALQGIPVLAFISALVWRRRSDSLARNPRLRRQREVAQAVQDGAAQLRQLAQEKKSDDFFAVMFRLLQEQIGERLDAPASAITEAVVEERLRPAGVAASLLDRVQELFQACNLARYAPVKTSQELAAEIPKLEQVLRELQGLKL